MNCLLPPIMGSLIQSAKGSLIQSVMGYTVQILPVKLRRSIAFVSVEENRTETSITRALLVYA
jgi:hypothetical protein